MGRKYLKRDNNGLYVSVKKVKVKQSHCRPGQAQRLPDF
jgi:hypothetical protein